MLEKTARISAVVLVVLLASVSFVSPVFAEEDIDSDGLPDSWEIQYFGDLSQDGEGDFDSDGFTNLEEYEAGTDPTDPTQGPRPPIRDEV
ncbi:MAG: hypothetical protein V3U51_06845 [Thermoplasmata archaeon]